MSGGIFPAVTFPAGIFPNSIFQKASAITEPEICYPLSYSFREPITIIELGQGDSRGVDVILKAAGVGIDLTLATVKFNMTNQDGTVHHEINCKKGSVYQENTIFALNGGMTIPFRSIHSATVSTYYGEFVITYPKSVKTIPSSGYITVRVKEAV